MHAIEFFVISADKIKYSYPLYVSNILIFILYLLRSIYYPRLRSAIALSIDRS